MDNSTKVDIIPNIPLNKKLMNDIHNQNNPVIDPIQNESKIISENQNENLTQKQVENSKEIEAINPKKIRKRTTKRKLIYGNINVLIAIKAIYPILHYILIANKNIIGTTILKGVEGDLKKNKMGLMVIKINTIH